MLNIIMYNMRGVSFAKVEWIISCNWNGFVNCTIRIQGIKYTTEQLCGLMVGHLAPMALIVAHVFSHLDCLFRFNYLWTTAGTLLIAVLNNIHSLTLLTILHPHADSFLSVSTSSELGDCWGLWEASENRPICGRTRFRIQTFELEK